MLQIALYDDNAAHRGMFRDLVTAFTFEKELRLELLEFQSLQELLETPPTYQILLLDIMLEGGTSGIEAAQALRAGGFSGVLILITSAPEYALAGYAADTFRYLVKPVERRAFFDALAAALDKLQTSGARIAVLCGGETCYFRVSDVVMVESYYHVRRIHTTGGVFETRESLSSLEGRLPRRQFASPHKSFLVNLDHVAKTRATRLFLADGRELPITRKRQRDFVLALHRYMTRQGG